MYRVPNIGKTGCSITGLPGYPAEDITLSNICLTFEGGGRAEIAGREIPELPEAYPEHNMFGELPAYGFYCRHCRNIRFNNIELGVEKPEARPAIICDDVEELEMRGIKAATGTTSPVLQFSGVKNALVQSCRTCEGTETFLDLKGMENHHITLTGNDLSYAKIPVSGENRSSVFLEGNRIAAVSGKSDGRYVNCDLQYTDDREIRINTPAEVTAKRLEIISAIWGTDRLPDRSDVIVTQRIVSPLSPNTAVSRVDKMEIPVSAIVPEGSTAIRDLAYLFVPVSRNNRLVMLNPGHTCKLDSAGNDFRIEADHHRPFKIGL